MTVPANYDQVPDPTILRLPAYSDYLIRRLEEGETTLRSAQMAESLGLTGIQVRKDLAWVSDSGKPRRGYPIKELLDDIHSFLGYDREKICFLAGAGHLGTALLHYQGFSEYGIHMVAAFDTDESLHGQQIGQARVYPMEDLERLSKEYKPQMMILCVPADVAQETADAAVAAGIHVIWNFAPATLKLDDDVIVENMNMAQSLALLSNRAFIKQMKRESEAQHAAEAAEAKETPEAAEEGTDGAEASADASSGSDAPSEAEPSAGEPAGEGQA